MHTYIHNQLSRQINNTFCHADPESNEYARDCYKTRSKNFDGVRNVLTIPNTEEEK